MTGKKPKRPSGSRRRKTIVNLSAEEITRATQGELRSGKLLARAVGVSSDSREIGEGELFIPLRGPNFDGHRFIGEALKKGAAGALSEKEEEIAGPSFPDKFLIRVPDTLRALGELARFWRRRQTARVIAITGSNGKTTTKEMTVQILARRFRILKNEGNLNNLIGLPLSLLRLSEEDEVAVLEMGMNAPGEIRRLKEIADPQISLITNIGRAHLEFLGDLEGVARAKGELWEGLREDDWIAVNVDDERVVNLAASARCRKVSFGIRNPAEIQGGEIRAEAGKGIGFTLRTANQERKVNLCVFGRHNIYNALAAASLAGAMGVEGSEIAAGLETFQPVYGRGKPLFLPGGIHVLDDSYNSNPDSLEAALAAFAEMKGEGRGIVVLGDMLEIGPLSKEFHERVGRLAGGMRFAHLFVFGEAARHIAVGAKTSGMEAGRIHFAADMEELLQTLEKTLVPEDWILIKGSRRMRMERVIEGIKLRFERT
jgi:UDP-N-acetylmuramoyl-tripeptide--D-alanyl-D-alanine ligase